MQWETVASVNVSLSDPDLLQSRRKAKKAERAQKKADLEYAEILAEEDRLVKRINQTSLYSHLMDPASFKKKGKIRETPKSKKPTPLKRVILKEREEKKQAREKATDQVADQTWVALLSPFNSALFTPTCYPLHNLHTLDNALLDKASKKVRIANICRELLSTGMLH